jgi:probable addiction module antidote protein
MVKVSKFDAADYLKTPIAIASYLNEAFETNDPAYICTALDTVARAKGIGDVEGYRPVSREPLQDLQGDGEARVRHRSKGHALIGRKARCRADRRTERGLIAAVPMAGAERYWGQGGTVCGRQVWTPKPNKINRIEVRDDLLR